MVAKWMMTVLLVMTMAPENRGKEMAREIGLESCNGRNNTGSYSDGVALTKTSVQALATADFERQKKGEPKEEEQKTLCRKEMKAIERSTKHAIGKHYNNRNTYDRWENNDEVFTPLENSHSHREARARECEEEKHVSSVSTHVIGRSHYERRDTHGNDAVSHFMYQRNTCVCCSVGVRRKKCEELAYQSGSEHPNLPGSENLLNSKALPPLQEKQQKTVQKTWHHPSPPCLDAKKTLPLSNLLCFEKQNFSSDRWKIHTKDRNIVKWMRNRECERRDHGKGKEGNGHRQWEMGNCMGKKKCTMTAEKGHSRCNSNLLLRELLREDHNNQWNNIPILDNCLTSVNELGNFIMHKNNKIPKHLLILNDITSSHQTDY